MLQLTVTLVTHKRVILTGIVGSPVLRVFQSGILNQTARLPVAAVMLPLVGKLTLVAARVDVLLCGVLDQVYPAPRLPSA